MKNEKKTSTLAIVGLILSILLTGISGLIISIIALSDAKEKGKSSGAAIAGIVISAIKVLLIIAFFALYNIFIDNFNQSIYDQITINTICSAAQSCKVDPSDSSSMICEYDDGEGNIKTISCPTN